MHRLRFAILGAVAALALGTGTAVAMQQSTVRGTDRDSHGDAVASAARTTCPHGSELEHGQCVSAVAQEDQTEKQQGDQGDAQSAKVQACKAKDTTEDSTEKKPAKGDKAAKSADQTEDKAEHKTFAGCVSGA